MQLASITRGFGVAAAAAAVLLFTHGHDRAGAAARQQSAATASTLEAAGWSRAPAYAALFAPEAQRAAYQFFTTPRAIGEVLAQIVQDPASVLTPGGWTARPLLPFDAFGQSGRYDRTILARLYGARRAQVARGPRREGGAITESWTLISPYPDTGLSRLERGTLLIILRLP